MNDAFGNTQAVQMPLGEWKKVVRRLDKYEQALKLQSELKEALKEVEMLKASKARKQTLTEFLDEL